MNGIHSENKTCIKVYSGDISRESRYDQRDIARHIRDCFSQNPSYKEQGIMLSSWNNHSSNDDFLRQNRGNFDQNMFDKAWENFTLEPILTVDEKGMHAVMAICLRPTSGKVIYIQLPKNFLNSGTMNLKKLSAMKVTKKLTSDQEYAYKNIQRYMPMEFDGNNRYESLKEKPTDAQRALLRRFFDQYQNMMQAGSVLEAFKIKHGLRHIDYGNHQMMISVNNEDIFNMMNLKGNHHVQYLVDNTPFMFLDTGRDMKLTIETPWVRNNASFVDVMQNVDAFSPDNVLPGANQKIKMFAFNAEDGQSEKVSDFSIKRNGGINGIERLRVNKNMLIIDASASSLLDGLQFDYNDKGVLVIRPYGTKSQEDVIRLHSKEVSINHIQVRHESNVYDYKYNQDQWLDTRDDVFKNQFVWYPNPFSSYIDRILVDSQYPSIYQKQSNVTESDRATYWEITGQSPVYVKGEVNKMDIYTIDAQRVKTSKGAYVKTAIYDAMNGVDGANLYSVQNHTDQHFYIEEHVSNTTEKVISPSIIVVYNDKVSARWGAAGSPTLKKDIKSQTKGGNQSFYLQGMGTLYTTNYKRFSTNHPTYKPIVVEIEKDGVFYKPSFKDIFINDMKVVAQDLNTYYKKMGKTEAEIQSLLAKSSPANKLLRLFGLKKADGSAYKNLGSFITK